MVQCAIFGCNSNNNKNLKRNKNEHSEKLKFFKFPKDELHEKIWLDKCGRKDQINVKNASVCSKHFSRECYIRNLQHELLNYSPKSSRKLKPDAIPSKNLPFPEIHNKQLEVKQESTTCVQELIGHEQSIVAPLKIDKSTYTGEDERLLRLQDELEELLLQHSNALAENYALKKEMDVINEILTPAQRKMLQKINLHK